MTPQSAGLAMDAVAWLVRGFVSSEPRKMLIDVRDIRQNERHRLALCLVGYFLV